MLLQMSQDWKSMWHEMNEGRCESLLKGQRCGCGIEVMYFMEKIEQSFVQSKLQLLKWNDHVAWVMVL